jgi:hypothetical protein
MSCDQLSPFLETFKVSLDTPTPNLKALRLTKGPQIVCNFTITSQVPSLAPSRLSRGPSVPAILPSLHHRYRLYRNTCISDALQQEEKGPVQGGDPTGAERSAKSGRTQPDGQRPRRLRLTPGSQRSVLSESRKTKKGQSGIASMPPALAKNFGNRVM